MKMISNTSSRTLLPPWLFWGTDCKHFTLGPLPFIFLPDLVTNSLLWYVDCEFDRLLKINLKKVILFITSKKEAKIKAILKPRQKLNEMKTHTSFFLSVQTVTTTQ